MCFAPRSRPHLSLPLPLSLSLLWPRCWSLGARSRAERERLSPSPPLVLTRSRGKQSEVRCTRVDSHLSLLPLTFDSLSLLLSVWPSHPCLSSSLLSLAAAFVCQSRHSSVFICPSPFPYPVIPLLAAQSAQTPLMSVRLQP